MTMASYERQHLSAYAAGYISSGATPSSQGFGCGLTRLATGIYAILFGADDGLVNNDSLTFVSVKGTSATVPLTVTVEDTSNTVKTIFVKDAAAVLTNSALEVAVFRTVTQT